MTYIVPAVFCLWVVFNEPVRHGPKQSIFNHYLQYFTVYCKSLAFLHSFNENITGDLLWDQFEE